MLITETFKDNGLSTSFEVFPPKNNAPYKPVEDAVDKLAVYRPDFISVTYGAGGGTSVNTPKIAAHIQNDLSIPGLAHLTCASSTKKATRAGKRSFSKRRKADGSRYLFHCTSEFCPPSALTCLS